MTSPTSPLPIPVALRLLQRCEFPRKLGVCGRLFGRALAHHGICWVRTAAGPVWKLDLTNHTHRWLVFGHYEGPGLWRWLEPRRASIRNIVDSGANIGQTVIHFTSLAPQARVFAYEPGAAARAWLTESVAANALHQVSIFPAGLGASAGEARLSDDGGPGRHGSWNKVNPTLGEPIVLVTLDDELSRLGIDTVDLWKLDMEGYEEFALQGAERALSSGRIRIVYIEAAGDAGRGNLAQLVRHGYRVHGIDSAGRLVGWRHQHNYENALCLAPNEPGNAH